MAPPGDPGGCQLVQSPSRCAPDGTLVTMKPAWVSTAPGAGPSYACRWPRPRSTPTGRVGVPGRQQSGSGHHQISPTQPEKLACGAAAAATPDLPQRYVGCPTDAVEAMPRTSARKASVFFRGRGECRPWSVELWQTNRPRSIVRPRAASVLSLRFFWLVPAGSRLRSILVRCAALSGLPGGAV